MRAIRQCLKSLQRVWISIHNQRNTHQNGVYALKFLDDRRHETCSSGYHRREGLNLPQQQGDSSCIVVVADALRLRVVFGHHCA